MLAKTLQTRFPKNITTRKAVKTVLLIEKKSLIPAKKSNKQMKCKTIAKIYLIGFYLIKDGIEKENLLHCSPYNAERPLSFLQSLNLNMAFLPGFRARFKAIEWRKMCAVGECFESQIHL